MPGSASGLHDSSAAGEVEGQAAALGQTERGLLEAEMEITSGPRRTRGRRGCHHHRAGAPHLVRGPARDPTESLKEAPCLASPSALCSAAEVRDNAGEPGDKANKSAARGHPGGQNQGRRTGR